MDETEVVVFVTVPGHYGQQLDEREDFVVFQETLFDSDVETERAHARIPDEVRGVGVTCKVDVRASLMEQYFCGKNSKSS